MQLNPGGRAKAIADRRAASNNRDERSKPSHRDRQPSLPSRIRTRRRRPAPPPPPSSVAKKIGAASAPRPLRRDGPVRQPRAAPFRRAPRRRLPRLRLPAPEPRAARPAGAGAAGTGTGAVPGPGTERRCVERQVHGAGSAGASVHVRAGIVVVARGRLLPSRQRARPAAVVRAVAVPHAVEAEHVVAALRDQPADISAE